MNDENQLREQLEDSLLNAGVCPTEALLSALEAVAEAAAFRHGGAMLGDILGKLAPADRAKWLRVMGTGPSLAEAAAEINISKVSLHKQEHRLRRRLTTRA